MHRVIAAFFAILLAGPGITSTLAQSGKAPEPTLAPPAQATPATITVQDIMRKVAQTESTLITNIRSFRPIVEVYIQNVVPDDQQSIVPNQDTYFLGRFDW